MNWQIAWQEEEKMPNIAIVNYCNLKCKYCFAEDMIKEANTTITLENFKKLMNFICTNMEDNHIGILGGEPTLHPQFKNILLEIKDYEKQYNNLTTLIFTNGINLLPYIPYITE